jgi:serine/threonine protein kinase
MVPYGQFRFQVVGIIGEGGFGIVDEIEVTESNCEHPVGLRLARKRLKAQWAAHPQQKQRFEREIATLRAMDGHPNIITIKGEDLGTGERFYCMQKCASSARSLLV